MAMTSLSALRNESAIAGVRSRFPALRETADGEMAAGEIFFDNAAGAQVPDEVFDAMREYLLRHNVQRGGRYALSKQVDEQLAETRRLLAAFVNARSTDEIVFGLNATNLTRTVAEAFRPTLRAGDRVIVTELDHEANVEPWLRLEASGADVVFWKLRAPEAALDLEDLRALLKAPGGGPVRWLAMPLASNATGGIVDVAGAAALAHEAGGRVFVDAVHYAPHGPIDAQALDADFLVFSGYKIFGPHMGFLWGRAEALRELKPPREYFIPAEAPYAFEAGSQVYEGLAGMAGAMRYLASLGDGNIRHAMERIRDAEAALAATFLEAVAAVPGLKIIGDTSREPAGRRVPTFAFRIEDRHPAEVAETLALHRIHARDGHLYAPRLIKAIGMDPDVGVNRVSLCHYNTPAEIATFVDVLRAGGTRH
jgi:cysteine desulfurase family protein (TIGR01976 family)